MVRAIEGLIDRVGRAASWLALAIVVLMATNVVLRYLFSYGSVWSQELEWHLLTPLVLFGAAYGFLKGEHVRVDVIYTHLSPRVQVAINIAAAVLCLGISIAIVWLSIKYVIQAYDINEQSSDPGGLTHRWILKAIIPLGFALLALQSVAEVAKGIARLREARA